MTHPVVLFDWDGTLVHSLDIKIRNAGDLFSDHYGMPAEGIEAAYRRHSGIPRRALFEAILRENGLPALDEQTYHHLSQRFSELNTAILTDPGTQGLLPGDVLPALQALRQRGCGLYVSSSAITSEIRQVARSVGIEGCFDEILGSAPGFGKGPEHVAYVLHQRQTSRQQAVMVGDEPTDIALGQAAGVRVIAKAGTYPDQELQKAGADFVIHNLSELPGLLLNIFPAAENG